MFATVHLTSKNEGEINHFLSRFYEVDLEIEKNLNWQKKYANPIELAEMIGVFADNFDHYQLSMWISLDKNVFIRVTENNADDLIRYLYERFPY